MNKKNSLLNRKIQREEELDVGKSLENKSESGEESDDSYSDSNSDSSLSDISNLSNFSKTSKIDSNKSEQDSSSLVDLATYSKAKSSASQPDIFLTNEVINVYENRILNEKIFLFKNNIDFCPIGKGVCRIIYGKVSIFGYEINSETDLEEFEFDVSERYSLYTCTNKGEIINSEEELIQTCRKFIGQDKNNLINLKDFFTIGRDRISLVYFKEISENFEILSKNDLMSIKYEYVDLFKYERYLYNDIFSENKKFLICGKKNSGKSTFLLYLINKNLSKIKQTIKSTSTRQTHPYLFLLDCDSGQPLMSSPFNVSFIKINKPILSNYYSNQKLNCEIFKSLVVEESTPTNNFEDYLKAVKVLSDSFKLIENSNSHFMIVNTNGYTSGIGNIINSSIIDIVKPDINFYVKNKKSGRAEKGEEFENYILKEEEKSSLNIILRQHKVDLNPSTNSRSKITKLDVESILIENEFDLKEELNLKKKNLNKSLYIYSNLVGNQFSLNNEKFSNMNTFTINDIIMGKDKNVLPLVNFSFDDLIFSFNQSDFTPKNELDLFFSINAKMCFTMLNTDESNKKIFKVGTSSVIHFNEIENRDRTFCCFAFVYNIDIIERKVILLSEELKNRQQDGKIILYRNISTLDKNITAMKESVLFENLLMDKKFCGENLFKNEKQNENINSNISKEPNQLYYYSRNKYSII